MKKQALLLISVFSSLLVSAQYNGTGSVTQGEGDTIAANIFTCTGGRVTNTGSILAVDSTFWELPASINYLNTGFPASSDLYNQCNEIGRAHV